MGDTIIFVSNASLADREPVFAMNWNGLVEGKSVAA